MAVKASAEVTLLDQTDASAIVSWYQATTGSVAPAVPSTTDASTSPSGWSRSEPTVSGSADLSKYAWRCEQLVWGDGSCSWGDVTLSSSYEAAKVAYNEAQSARQTATSFITELADGIMVHPSGDSTTGWSMRDALELLRSGASHFKVWTESNVAKMRVGLESTTHMVIDGTGLRFKSAANNLLSLVTGSSPGVVIYDGGGNDSGNITASISAAGVVLGPAGRNQTTVAPDALRMSNAQHMTTLEVAEAGTGSAEVSESFAQDATWQSFSFSISPAVTQGSIIRVDLVGGMTDDGPLAY